MGEEDLHQVRLAIKRLRAILRLLRPLVSETFFKRENARLRTAARRLARLRDFAVARRTLEQVTDKLASHLQDAAVQEVFASFLAQTPESSHYDEDRETALRLAGRALAQTRHAFHALPLPDRGWKTIEPGLKKLYRQNRIWMKCALSKQQVVEIDRRDWNNGDPISSFRSLNWCLRWCKVMLEPLACQPRHLIERSRLFEEVCRSGNDHQPLLGAELRERRLVQLDNCVVISADDEQRGCSNSRQGWPSQIRAPAPRNDRAHYLGALGRGH
jgi:CHAD domain